MYKHRPPSLSGQGRWEVSELECNFSVAQCLTNSKRFNSTILLITAKCNVHFLPLKCMELAMLCTLMYKHLPPSLPSKVIEGFRIEVYTQVQTCSTKHLELASRGFGIGVYIHVQTSSTKPSEQGRLEFQN